MDLNKTNIFNVAELRQELILMTINEIVEALEFKGYDPTSQLVGYITTGDIKYITNFNDSRKKISKYNRSEILTALVNSYLGK